jgi:hypothetical protein
LYIDLDIFLVFLTKNRTLSHIAIPVRFINNAYRLDLPAFEGPVM